MAGSILRQLSVSGGEEALKSTSNSKGSSRWNLIEGLNGGKKRVMVVVDQSTGSKQAMMWALTHVANKGDMLTLLHIISGTVSASASASSGAIASFLGSLCKASRPQVQVEALVIHGPKLSTVLSQVKKLEVSVLVLVAYTSKPTIISCLFGLSNTHDFAEQCINNAECLAIAAKPSEATLLAPGGRKTSGF